MILERSEVVMKQTDHVSCHIFLDKYSRQLVEFAEHSYGAFLRDGKGVLIVDETRDDGCKYYYSTTNQTDDYTVDFDDYDAEKQVYFVWKRKDYPDECFVFQDTQHGGPKYIYEWSQIYKTRFLRRPSEG